MINIKNLLKEEPYQLFEKLYKKAYKAKQNSIEAVCVSSISKDNYPHGRFVNLKYIIESDFIFFSNYKSAKAEDFISTPYTALTFYWNTIDVQIRIEGEIKISASNLSDQHFNKRSNKKNALAISSDQSRKAKSYDEILFNYNNVLNISNLEPRPSYWGGYSVSPNYFEFWEGNENRLNKRNVFKKENNKWNNFILQP